MKKYLTIASMIIFSVGFLVCDYMYDTNTPDELLKAWTLRMILISFYTILLIIANISPYRLYETKQMGVITIVSVMALILDIRDKLNGINHFTLNDLIYIGGSLISSVILFYTQIGDILWQRLKKLKP